MILVLRIKSDSARIVLDSDRTPYWITHCAEELRCASSKYWSSPIVLNFLPIPCQHDNTLAYRLLIRKTVYEDKTATE
jgi:hypothetical protein